MDATQSKTYLPARDVDDEFARMCAALADQQLRDGDMRPRLVLGDGDSIELPAEVVDILQRVAAAMRSGHAISVVPRDTVLSTQEAADMLGISRPTLVRLLEEGEIPFTKPRRHRRILLADVVTYQDRQRHVADTALSDIVADAQRFTDYEDDPDQVRTALTRARHEKDV